MKGVKKAGLFLSFLICVSVLTCLVSATTLFSDNFEGNLSKWIVSDGSKVGLNNSNPSPAGGNYVWIKHNAYITASINTTNCNNIIFSYYRATKDLESSDKLRIYWRIDSGSWTELENTNFVNWVAKVWNLAGAENKSQIQIKFFLDDSSHDYGYVDDVVVSGNCQATPPSDTTPPTCSVDYIQKKSNNAIYPLSNPTIYMSDAGDFYIYGSANDSQSSIANVQYNRTSPDLYLLWTDADPKDGLFNQLNEEYRNKPNDPDSFVEGTHQICCRAADSAGNVQSPGNCKEICMDKSSPVMDSLTDNTKDCDETSAEYWNSNSVTWSWTSHDVGCAGIDHYIVKVMEAGNPTPIEYNNYVTSTSYTNINSLSDGTYYLTVIPVDKAGNIGDAMNSANIIIDLTNPNVVITGPATGEGIWYDPGFSVSETEGDTNLDKCYYQITDTFTGNTNGWVLMTCGADVFVDPNIYCPNDGAYCQVDKKATDKACNIGTDSRTFNVDTHNPTINKEVVGNKIDPFTEYWQNLLINGFFIKNTTEITLSCNDGEGSGVQVIYYTINSGETQTYTTPFTLNPDGLYTINYWCVDNVNKSSQTGIETDKVDDLPPVTVKTIGQPKYTDNLGRLWVTSATNFTLTCSDTEVGCKNSYFNINSAGWNIGTLFNLEESDNFVLQLYSGWNLVSIPLEPVNTSRDAIFSPSFIDAVWQYNNPGGYIVPETIQPKIGYLVKANQNVNITITGIRPIDDTVQVNAGWNLIGVVGNQNFPSESFVQAIWQYNNPEGYSVPSNLVEGKGYWVKSDASGTLFSLAEDGMHFIEYYSDDLLGNAEIIKNQTDWLDNTPPTIIMHNPKNNGEEVTEDISRCDQSIVVEAWDNKAGVNDASIYAVLINSDNETVKNITLVKAINQKGLLGGDVYSGTMNKELPAGEYTLKVYASDNLGNTRVIERKETLKEGIYVEYLDPSSCAINIGQSKQCKFTFHVCARNVSMIDMCMDEIGENPGLITPYDLNATISKGQGLAYVGLCDVSQGNPKDLQLSETKINGKTTFDLTLNFNADTTSILGTGNYDFNYTINFWDP